MAASLDDRDDAMEVVVVDEDELDFDDFQSFVDSRKKSTEKYGRIWRNIINKYSDPSLETDVVDLASLDIVLDNGNLESEPVKPYGYTEFTEARPLKDEGKYWLEALKENDKEEKCQVTHSPQDKFNKTYLVNGTPFSQSEYNCYKTFKGELQNREGCVLEDSAFETITQTSDSDSYNDRGEQMSGDDELGSSEDEDGPACSNYLYDEDGEESTSPATTPPPSKRQRNKSNAKPVKLEGIELPEFNAMVAEYESKYGPVERLAESQQANAFPSSSRIGKDKPFFQTMKNTYGSSGAGQAAATFKYPHKRHSEPEKPLRRIQTTILAPEEVVTDKYFMADDSEHHDDQGTIGENHPDSEEEESIVRVLDESVGTVDPVPVDCNDTEKSDHSSFSECSEEDSEASIESGVYEMAKSPNTTIEVSPGGHTDATFTVEAPKISVTQPTKYCSPMKNKVIPSCSLEADQEFEALYRRISSPKEHAKIAALPGSKSLTQAPLRAAVSPRYTKMKNIRSLEKCPSPYRGGRENIKAVNSSPRSQTGVRYSAGRSPVVSGISEAKSPLSGSSGNKYSNSQMPSEGRAMPSPSRKDFLPSRSPSSYQQSHRNISSPSASVLQDTQKERNEIPWNYFDRPLSVRNEMLSPLALILQKRKREQEEKENILEGLKQEVTFAKEESEVPVHSLKSSTKERMSSLLSKYPDAVQKVPVIKREIKCSSPGPASYRTPSSTPSKPGAQLKMDLDISCIPKTSGKVTMDSPRLSTQIYVPHKCTVRDLKISKPVLTKDSQAPNKKAPGDNLVKTRKLPEKKLDDQVPDKYKGSVCKSDCTLLMNEKPDKECGSPRKLITDSKDHKRMTPSYWNNKSNKTTPRQDRCKDPPNKQKTLHHEKHNEELPDWDERPKAVRTYQRQVTPKHVKDKIERGSSSVPPKRLTEYKQTVEKRRSRTPGPRTHIQQAPQTKPVASIRPIPSADGKTQSSSNSKGRREKMVLVQEKSDSRDGSSEKDLTTSDSESSDDQKFVTIKEQTKLKRNVSSSLVSLGAKSTRGSSPSVLKTRGQPVKQPPSRDSSRDKARPSWTCTKEGLNKEDSDLDGVYFLSDSDDDSETDNTMIDEERKSLGVSNANKQRKSELLETTVESDTTETEPSDTSSDSIDSDLSSREPPIRRNLGRNQSLKQIRTGGNAESTPNQQRFKDVRNSHVRLIKVDDKLSPRERQLKKSNTPARSKTTSRSSTPRKLVSKNVMENSPASLLGASKKSKSSLQQDTSRGFKDERDDDWDDSFLTSKNSSSISHSYTRSSFKKLQISTPKSKDISAIKNQELSSTASPCPGRGLCRKAFCFKCCDL